MTLNNCNQTILTKNYCPKKSRKLDNLFLSKFWLISCILGNFLFPEKFVIVTAWDLAKKKVLTDTAKKMEFTIKDFFSKCDQIPSFLRIWSHLLKKSLMENFIFLCSVIIKKGSEVHELTEQKTISFLTYHKCCCCFCSCYWKIYYAITR